MVLELPEMSVIARQMKENLGDKRINRCICGNTPHKFAWYNHPKEVYADLLSGTMIKDVYSRGNHLFAKLTSDRVLVIGDLGGRIQLYPPGEELPGKHQLLLGFEDDSHLAVIVVMWGGIQVLAQADLLKLPYLVRYETTPLDDTFTMNYFRNLVAEIPENSKTSVKYMLVSIPGIAGIGNGCLQDILFNAHLHPRHPARSLSEAEQLGLYTSIRETLQQMIEEGGRDNETDLFGKKGGYTRILGSHKVGKPCPRCGGIIEKAAYLGGTVYFCPVCQV